MPVNKKALIELMGKDNTSRAFSEIHKRFNRLKAAGRKAFAFGKWAALGVGAAGAAFAILEKRIADAGDKLDKMSKRTGLDVSFLDQLGHAAELSGTSIERLEKGVVTLVRRAEDAARGGTFAKYFEQLGVEVKDANGELKDGRTLLMDVAGALAGMENESERVALATRMFSKSVGADLLPMMREGKGGIENMLNEARDLSNVWNKETTGAAAKFNDSLSNLGRGIGGIVDQFGASLLPGITDITGGMAEWIKKNREVIKQDVAGAAKEVAEGLKDAYETVKKWADDGSLKSWFKELKGTVQETWSGLEGLDAVIQGITAKEKGVPKHLEKKALDINKHILKPVFDPLSKGLRFMTGGGMLDNMFSDTAKLMTGGGMLDNMFSGTAKLMTGGGLLTDPLGTLARRGERISGENRIRAMVAEHHRKFQNQMTDQIRLSTPEETLAAENKQHNSLIRSATIKATLNNFYASIESSPREIGRDAASRDTAAAVEAVTGYAEERDSQDVASQAAQAARLGGTE